LSGRFIINCNTVELEQADGHIRGLIDYWEGRRLKRPMPVRRDLDVLDLRQWLGRLSLYEVMGDGDFFIRLRGTVMSSVPVPNHAADGTRVSRTKPGIFAEMGLQHYQQAYALERPLIHHVELAHDGDLCVYDRVSLPLAEGAGLPPMILTYVTCDIPRCTEFWRRYNEAHPAKS
jgi:hypothetical protein